MMYREHEDPNSNELLRLTSVGIANRAPAQSLAGRLTRLGNFLLIGTLQTQEAHAPTLNHQNYDTNLRAWVLDRKASMGPVLYATRIGGIAVLSALFGDLNEFDQRKRLGIPLTDADRPHFGWEKRISSVNTLQDTREHFDYTYYALPELISAARKLGPDLRGSIDVIAKPRLIPYLKPPEEDGGYPRFITEAPDIAPGISHGVFGFGDAETYMSIPVDGTDLPLNVKPLILP